MATYDVVADDGRYPTGREPKARAVHGRVARPSRVGAEAVEEAAEHG